MTFAHVFALAAAFLVVAPLVAHLLRRRKTETRAFAPARLVAAAPPVAKHRARLEDRSLFLLRAFAVLALAVLGATPFLHCSRLSMGRRGGASIGLVLVVDDSLSMRAPAGRSNRFARAVSGAREVLGAARDGDGVAVVAAGAPSRVLLASTTDLSAASRALDALGPTDRATDLDGALSLAASLARAMPQPDKRIILLSDLADGRTTAAPLGAGLGLPVWAPLADVRGRLPDCAVIHAERRGANLSTRVVCGDDADADGRVVEVLAGDRIVASSPLAHRRAQEVTVVLPSDAPPPTLVRLSGHDALPTDDQAPVLTEPGTTAVAVVSDVTQSGVETGGPPPVEQAFAALDETLTVRPLPGVPDQADDLAPFAAIVLDDPPGLTPEARAAFRNWIARGGVGVVLIGPHAGGAILGAEFEPFVPGAVRWMAPAPRGADLGFASAVALSPAGFDDLAAKGRAMLEARAADGATVLARWSDGAPLLLSRPLERGVAITATLPSSLDVSDVALRPAFLDILAHVAEAARAHGGERHSLVGASWAVRVPGALEVRGPDGERVAVRNDASSRTVVPERAGAYRFAFADGAETRVAEVSEAEVDLSPRAAPPEATDDTFGSARASIDVSPYVAFVLLLTIAAEAWLRALQLRARTS